MRRLASLLLPVLLLSASCGGPSDPAELVKSGERSLGSQDFAAALRDFETALQAIGGDTSHTSYVRAKLGEIEARASAGDAARARTDLVALADAQPGTVSDADFNRIVSRMGDTSKFREAVALLQKGLELYPDSAHLDKLGKKLAADAEKADDPEALEALKGMGYVGE